MGRIDTIPKSRKINFLELKQTNKKSHLLATVGEYFALSEPKRQESCLPVIMGKGNSFPPLCVVRRDYFSSPE